MERYSSFKELKEHDYSNPRKNIISRNTENEVKAFIEILRKSAISTKKEEPRKKSDGK